MTTTTLVYPVAGNTLLNQINSPDYRGPSPGDWVVEFANSGKVFLPPDTRVKTRDGCLQSVEDLVAGKSYVQFPIQTSYDEGPGGSPQFLRRVFLQVVRVGPHPPATGPTITPVPTSVKSQPIPINPVYNVPLPAPEFELPDYVARFEFQLENG